MNGITWFSVAGTVLGEVMELLEHEVLQEEVCHWRWALRVYIALQATLLASSVRLRCDLSVFWSAHLLPCLPTIID